MVPQACFTVSARTSVCRVYGGNRPGCAARGAPAQRHCGTSPRYRLGRSIHLAGTEALGAATGFRCRTRTHRATTSPPRQGRRWAGNHWVSFPPKTCVTNWLLGSTSSLTLPNRRLAQQTRHRHCPGAQAARARWSPAAGSPSLINHRWRQTPRLGAQPAGEDRGQVDARLPGCPDLAAH